MSIFRHVAFIFVVICCAGYAQGQALPVDSLGGNADMERFYAGCMKIAEAENAADSAVRNSSYAAAMELLNKRSTYSRPGVKLARMRVEICDSTGLVSTSVKDFAYDYSYARARYRAVDFAPTGVSRGGLTGCRVFDMVLAPGARVRCSEKVRGNCVLVAVAQPGGAVALTVEDNGTTIKGAQYEGGLVSYAHWHTGAEHPVAYTVENKSDREITVTLMAN